MGGLIFIFLFFFVNRFVDCFFCTVFTIFIIKCKASFSCHSSSSHYSTQGFVLISFHFIFRWFKFTLKPPYSIMHDKLRLAIWDTSFWTFLVKFGHKGP